MKWTVGLITAPRKQGYYLDQTLKSLITAGWNEVIVFAEPGSVIPNWFHGPVVHRWKQFGDWCNWGTALYELLLSCPETDFFFMIEDDGLVCKGAKDYLEQTLPTLEDFGTVSIYCPGRYHKDGFCGFHDECRGALTWSTLTVIMSRKGVRSFFSDPDVQKHRFENIFPQNISWGFDVDPKNSAKDALLGQWALKNRLPMFYHTPSLAAHIGVHSTLSDKETTWENLAKDFVGEEFIPIWGNIKVRHIKNLSLL